MEKYAVRVSAMNRCDNLTAWKSITQPPSLNRNRGHLTGNINYNPPAHRMWSRDNKVHYNSGADSVVVRAIEMVRGFATGMDMETIGLM